MEVAWEGVPCVSSVLGSLLFAQVLQRGWVDCQEEWGGGVSVWRALQGDFHLELVVVDVGMLEKI